MKMNLSSDTDLLFLITLGDEDALAALYDRYCGVLLGLLLRILHQRSEAEDILQEVFLQVWQRAANFDVTRGKPFTWLVTLTRSRAIDRLRSLRSRLATGEKAAAEIFNFNQASDPCQDASNAVQNAVVRRALKRLPETERHLLLLAYFAGLTQSEIAEKTGTPLGTVKSRIRAGMRKLRESLSSLDPQNHKTAENDHLQASGRQPSPSNNWLSIAQRFGAAEPAHPASSATIFYHSER